MISFFTNVIKKINNKIKVLKIIIKSNIKNNLVTSLKFNFNVNTLFTCIIVLTTLTILISNPKIILKMSNNLRQADDILDLAKSGVSLFSIYNSKNYILDKVEEKKKEEIIVENIKTEYQILDEMSYVENEVSVFSNVPQMSITENSSYVQRAFVGNVSILNYSYNRNINYSDIISSVSPVLTKKSDKILLYNTHTSESYANSSKYQFEYTGIRRTTDANYNMLRIAKEFSNNLNEKGFIAVQETTPHDYGTYTSAYAKSRITLQNAISSYGGFGIAIDVHRDAIEDLDFRPMVNIRGVEVARVMLVVGAGSKDNPNPYFEDNLKLALKLNYLGEQIYPGLFRPMYIRNSAYNQDLNKYSLLIEVGASGNTIEDAQNATRCITNLLNIIYKD